jgi:hypothetical protein
MPHSCEPSVASQKFGWEIRFYQCLSLPHVELADRALEAERIIVERIRQSESDAISPAEREALDDAIHHLRLIQIQHLGYPATAGELVRKHSPLREHTELDQPSCDLAGRPRPLSERRHIWKTYVA